MIPPASGTNLTSINLPDSMQPAPSLSNLPHELLLGIILQLPGESIFKLGLASHDLAPVCLDPSIERTALQRLQEAGVKIESEPESPLRRVLVNQASTDQILALRESVDQLQSQGMEVGLQVKWRLDDAPSLRQFFADPSQHPQSLEIRGVAWDDATFGHFVAGLAENKTLKELQLSACPLSTEQAALLGQALQQQARIEKLVIKAGPLQAGALLALARTLRNHRSLVELRINGQSLDERTGKALSKLVQSQSSIETLDLSHCTMNSKTLEKATDFKHSTHSKLKSLQLRGVQMRDADAQSLARRVKKARNRGHRIEDLDIRGNPFSQASTSELLIRMAREVESFSCSWKPLQPPPPL